MRKNNRKINDPKPQSSNPLDVARVAVALCLSVIALAAVAVHAQTRDDYCGGRPPPGFDQPLSRAHTGRYVNDTYGYSLTIPAGFTAFTSASGPERGFVIGLAGTPRVFLSVDASYDAFYDITAARRRSQSMRRSSCCAIAKFIGWTCTARPSVMPKICSSSMPC